MVCEVCGKSCGFYPMCKICHSAKEKGEIIKCKACEVWHQGKFPMCKDCWLKKQKEEEKKSSEYKETELEKEENNFRDKYPCNFRTEDGHKVRSKAEQAIDNWLYHKGIAHAYERRLPIEEEVYSDFFIPQGKIWIEYWGLNEEEYIKRRKIKMELYKKHSKNFIELTDKDIENLDDVLPSKLAAFFPKNFVFD